MTALPSCYGIKCDDGQWLSGYVMRCSYKSGTTVQLSFGPAKRAMAFPTDVEVGRRIIALRTNGVTELGMYAQPLWSHNVGGKVELAERAP